MEPRGHTGTKPPQFFKNITEVTYVVAWLLQILQTVCSELTFQQVKERRCIEEGFHGLNKYTDIFLL